MAVFQGLGAGDEPPHAVDRFALLTDDEVRIAQSAAIEQLRRDHSASGGLFGSGCSSSTGAAGGSAAGASSSSSSGNSSSRAFLIRRRKYKLESAFILVIDNRTSKLTSWDTDHLPDALLGLNDLDIFSFDDVLPLAATAGKTDPDDIPETPKNPVTRKGDLWVLGKHRIVCGDSTDQKTVERLLDGAEPDLMLTDPPYGMNYDSSWRYRSGISSKDGAFGKSTNDDQSDWRAAYSLFSGAIAYVWMASLTLPVAALGLEASGFKLRSLIIWDKGHIVTSRGHYHWRHESCWYAVRNGAQAHWKGDRKASTLWEIDNPRKSETGHSAQKPVECMQRAIHNHRGDVYDPFVGSGTTVIAGEQEGRSVYAIEIEPAYVDVSVKRWEDFTGQKAQRQK